MRHFFHQFYAEFWLPLPLIGGLFWLGTILLNQQVLSESSSIKEPLKADQEVEVQFSATLLVIEAYIQEEDNFTKVFVRTNDPALKRLELEFPVTEVEEIDRAIAQRLNLSLETVRRFTRYEYDY